MTDAAAMYGHRLAQWQERSEWPLAGVAVVFLAAYAWPILQPDLPHRMRTACAVVVLVSWAAFALDYVARVAIARRRRHYIARHLLDLASVALPVLRPLRLLRLVALVRALNRKATNSLHGRVATYVATSAVLIIFVSALAELDAERGHVGANVQTFGDALWWSATTVTTVGYGDQFPVTSEGRLVAIGLMLAGIALIGVVTASIASWLIASVRDAESDSQDELRREIAGLHAELADIRDALRAR